MVTVIQVINYYRPIMKSTKLFSLLILFLALFASSCSKDDQLDDEEDPDINVPYLHESRWGIVVI
ncbi:hypothetical protein GCM10011516_07220 [Sphingobacterium cellulitidis]|uniref:Uncharacterized protein n=2 Tax=Sphingobacteriaceae TaxID=84566 RepID=A0A8H9KSL6_9SPHI|nr:hypothetical protein GCM10011516_07220 [Sphingobacterium soli]